LESNKKILFFTEGLGSGGKERRIVELIKGLLKNNTHDVELVLTKESVHYKDIFNTNIKIHYLLRKNLIQKLVLFLKFYRIAKKMKPDIVHVWGYVPAFYAIPAKLLLKSKLINNEIANAPMTVSKSIFRQKLTFFFSDKVVSNSNAGLKSYKAPKHKSHVIYNGFDFKRLDNLKNEKEVRATYNITTKFVVAMVATFSPKKDYVTFIEAANKALAENIDITFLCIGTRSSSHAEELVLEKNKKNILFLGGQTDVESIMNICDIGVLITNHRTHGEGIPNALLEFMALKKPVIANSCGGTNELLSDTINGFLVGNENPEELKSKIIEVLSDDLLRSKLGEASRKIVEEKFNIEQMIFNFEKLYIETTKN